MGYTHPRDDIYLNCNFLNFIWVVYHYSKFTPKTNYRKGGITPKKLETTIDLKLNAPFNGSLNDTKIKKM